MKNIKSFTAILVLSIIVISKTSFSQDLTTYNFLKLDLGARPSALGGSFNSNTNDVISIFYNPAALSTLTSTQAKIGFFKYLLDINSGNIAYGQRLKDAGYIGGGIRYMNYGTFDKFDEQSTNLGTFNANDLAISLGYSNIYKNNFHYGVNLKVIYSNIDEYSSTAIAADIGVLYTIPSSQWNFGLSLLNAGTQLSEYNSTKEDLPIDLRIGVSKKLEHLPLRAHFEFDNLTQSVDQFFDRFKNISVGGEFDFSDYVQFRIGYNNNQRQDLKTGSSLGIAGFSAGLGFKFLDYYSIDYAFNSMGKVGSTQRIDVGFALK
ncbi:MAG: type IX secretion system protein PorQ [Bacteroidota bacterium]|nr:type IX secretion system protein PorQ [Bacteroidota bacterium]